MRTATQKAIIKRPALPLRPPPTPQAAQLVNYGTQFLEIGWAISLGLAAVPAAILTIGCLFVPETPNFLVESNKVSLWGS